eukprot:8936363-Alexandrium_andersonii.AAC.1
MGQQAFSTTSWPMGRQVISIGEKGEAELKERLAWSQKWRQRRKEERLRRRFQQEVSHALGQQTSKF